MEATYQETHQAPASQEKTPSPYRQVKQTARGLLRRVQRSLVAALVLYKLLTVAVFIPLMQQLWALALRLSPTKYITTDNMLSLLRSPQLLVAIVVIGLATAWWTLYEFSLILCGLEYARRGQRCHMLPLLGKAAAGIRHALLPKNWGVLLYTAVLIPFTNVFLSSHYISQLAVPEYIAEVIHDNALGSIAYTAGFLALCALAVCWLLCLHYFVLGHYSFRDARKAAFAWLREKPLQRIGILARWSLRSFWVCLLTLALPGLVLVVLLVAAGAFSNLLMLSMWRSFLLFLWPFTSYLVDCTLALMMEACLSAYYYLHTQQPSTALKSERRLPTGGPLLAVCWLVLLLLWALFSLMAALSPDMSETLRTTFYPPITVTCHRGYSAAAPENTLPAFEAAIEAGADCAELDVQMTKDGVVMVTHDTNLSRTTGRNANIYDLTYDEVRALDAGSFFDASFAGTTVPTLQEVLDTCKGRIRLNIEIKPSAETPTLEAETARLIVENGWEQDCVVTSLSYTSLEKVKEVAPQLRCGYIMAVGVGNYYDLPAADFFSVESTFITSSMVQELHLRGKTVSAWTIDRQTDAERMKELGVDDIITGDPRMVESVLQEAAAAETQLETLRDWFRPLLPDYEGDFFAQWQEALKEA